MHEYQVVVMSLCFSEGYEFESCKGRIEPTQILFSGGPQTLNFDSAKAAVQ